MGVHDIHLRDGGGHRDIGAQGPQGSIGAFGVVLGVGRRALAGLAHALDVDQITELAQLRDQLTDMDAGPTVDMGRVLTGED